MIGITGLFENDFIKLAIGLSSDRSASATIEYALLLGGLGLSALGVTSLSGTGINDLYEMVVEGLNYGSCIICVPN